jgi:hypothetical protein
LDCGEGPWATLPLVAPIAEAVNLCFQGLGGDVDKWIFEDAELGIGVETAACLGIIYIRSPFSWSTGRGSTRFLCKAEALLPSPKAKVIN